MKNNGYNEEEMLEYMFGEDGPDDGFDWTYGD